ncbi:MAG: hypothetical protein ACP5I8_09320, partial [Phycisphaerae bacterium]
MRGTLKFYAKLFRGNTFVCFLGGGGIICFIARLIVSLAGRKDVNGYQPWYHMYFNMLAISNGVRDLWVVSP